MRYFWKQDKFYGGQSDDSRTGPPGSSRYLVGLDIRSDSGKLQVAKKPVQDDGGIIVDLIKWIDVNPANNDVYLYGEDSIYKESGGLYTLQHSLTADSPNGQGLCDFDNFLYYRTATQLGRYDYASTWDDDWQVGLNSSVSFSPMCRFKNLLLVGHGRNVGSVDDVGTWTPDALTLPPGYHARSIFRAGTFAVILATRGTQITDSDEGLMFFWDGARQTYNDYVPLTGNPHAGIAYKNKIILICGQEPEIQESLGGVAEMQQLIPDVEPGKTAEVYPGAMDIFRGMVHFGISGGTDTDVLRVVHNWGKKKGGLFDSLNPEYPPSHGGLTGTTRAVTAVRKIGTTMRFAWKNGSSYGVDEIDMTQYQTSGTLRTLAFDRESPYEKTGTKVLIELVGALASGESVTVKANSDPFDDPTFANSSNLYTLTESTIGKRIVEVPLNVGDVQMRSRDLALEVTMSGGVEVKRIWTELNEDDDQL